MASSKKTWLPWAIVGGALAGILGLGLAAGNMLQTYDESIGFENEAERIAGILDLAPGMSVGDVRAGTGKWSVDMARRIGDGIVYATVGPDPPSVIYETVAAAQVDNVTVIVRTPGDAPRLPLNCCDATLVRFVYRHFENRAERIAHNLWLTSKPGGRLAIIDWQAGSPARNAVPKEVVIGEVTAQGFELERSIDDWAPDVYCLIFRKPEDAPSDHRRSLSVCCILPESPMVRSVLVAAAVSLAAASYLDAQDPREERERAAIASQALRQAYFDASGEPPLTIEQAFPHLAGAPLADPTFLAARRQALTSQRDACASERLEASSTDRAESVRRACDAEDAAAALEERLLAALIVGLRLAPGFTAESIERARAPWREARERAARLSEDDADFADATRTAQLAGEAERQLLRYQSAALRKMAIPSDPTLPELVENEMSGLDAGAVDEATRDRFVRAAPLLSADLSRAGDSFLTGGAPAPAPTSPAVGAAANDDAPELRSREQARHAEALETIRALEERYRALDAELGAARALTILDEARSDRLESVVGDANALVRAIRDELETLMGVRRAHADESSELGAGTDASIVRERETHTGDELEALLRLEKRVLMLRRAVMRMTSDPPSMTSAAFLEELVEELHAAPLWLELEWREDVRWLRALPETATDVNAIWRHLELSFDLLVLGLVWIYVRKQSTRWLRRAIVATQTKDTTRYGFGRRPRHLSDRELQPVARFATDAAGAFVLYRLLLPRSEFLALLALLWVGFALLRSIPAAIRLMLPLLGRALDPLEAEGEPPPEVASLGERTGNWFLRWWILSAVAAFVAVPLLEGDRLLQLINALSWVVLVLLMIVALALWTPWIRQFIANLADQSAITAWLSRPMRSKLQQITRSAIGGIYIVLRLVFWALVDRGWVSRSGTTYALSQLELADAAGELLSAEEKERIRAIDAAPIVRAPELEALENAFTSWLKERRRGIVVVVGDHGMGKSQFLAQAAAMLAETAAEVPVVGLELPAGKRTERVRERLSWLTEPLKATVPKNVRGSHLQKAIVEHLEASPPHVFLVDDLHFLLRRTVGGFDVLEIARNIIQACADEHFWVVTMHRPAWVYIDGASSAMKLAFRERIDLTPLDADRLGDSLVDRTRQAGFDPSFHSLLKGRRPHADEATLEQKARKLYWRIVSQASLGNPRVIADFWLASLGATNGDGGNGSRPIPVYLFAGHGDDEIETMSDEYLFLLTALVVHDGLRIDDLADVLNVAPSRVRVACQHLESLGIVALDEGRYLVTTHWQPAVARVLDRRNFAHR